MIIIIFYYATERKVVLWASRSVSATTLRLDLVLVHVVVGHARMRRPFELAGVNARCKSGAELFLPTAPPAVAIMHYYYPGTPRRPPQPTQCSAMQCAVHLYIFSWSALMLKIITRNQFRTIEALNFYQFIN